MKMRLVKTVQPMIGLTLREIYEGTVKNGFFCFNDDHGDERSRPDHQFEAVSSEKPNVGQWWLQTNKQDRSDAKYFRAYFCGRDAAGNLLFESVGGSIEKDAGGLNWKNWHHEPACTGWDWVPEVKPKEKWPQWYVPRNPDEVCETFKKPIAYYRRDSAKKGETFYTDGESFKWGYWEEQSGHEIIACSQADAESRVTKKPTLVIKAMPKDVAEPAWANAESPDDWVTQDRVPPRTDIDQFRWFGTDCGSPNGEWRIARTHWKTFKHGQEAGESRLEVRCRRKDLPVVEAKKTATVTVYEVVYGDDLNAMAHNMVACDSQLASMKRTWKYVSVVSTKTVEVML